MNRLLNIGTVSTLAIVTALSVGPPSAQAQSGGITCGATVMTDTRLTSDLLNCADNGLVIGADDITLDLNGHTIDGNGVPVGSCPSDAVCDVGIANVAGHNDVTIKGGTVQGFDVGVLVVGASEDHLNKISLANNTSFGMIVGNSTRSRVDHNSSVSDGISGIVVADSQRLRVDHNFVSGTTGYAVPVFGSSHNRFEHNVLTNDQHGILLGSSGQNPGSNNNKVRGNRLTDGPGIEVDQSKDNQVRNNVLTNPGDGILLIESRHTHVSNNIIRKAGIGFTEAGGFGILLDGATDNVLQRNSLSGGKGPGIFVTSLESPNTSDRNVVANNVVNSKLNSGILVNNNATATLLRHNTANGNGDDGIHVDAAGTTITGNTADNNLDLGIEAVVGVTDGGGNRASGNGDPRQCTHIVCTPLSALR
jgi:parallel beta-helix repeat protein